MNSLHFVALSPTDSPTDPQHSPSIPFSGKRKKQTDRDRPTDSATDSQHSHSQVVIVGIDMTGNRLVISSVGGRVTHAQTDSQNN